MVGRTERTIRGMRDKFSSNKILLTFSTSAIDLSEKKTTDKKEAVKCDTKNAREDESNEE